MFQNFDPILDRVYVGGAPQTPDDISDLWDCGVTHILRVDDVADDAPLILSAGLKDKIQYCLNPTDDPVTLTPPPKPVKWFEASLQFAEPVLTQPEMMWKLYVHCHDGVNRGPSTAYFLLRACYSLFHEDAKYLIRLHRPVAWERYVGDADAALAALGYAPK